MDTAGELRQHADTYGYEAEPYEKAARQPPAHNAH